MKEFLLPLGAVISFLGILLINHARFQNDRSRSRYTLGGTLLISGLGLMVVGL
jgi:hypothetical protein